MKSFLSQSLVAIALLMFFGSCQEAEKKEKIPEIIITGQIKGLNEEEISVSLFDILMEGSTDEAGNFELRFEYPEPAYFFVGDGRSGMDLFLSPGDSIHIELDRDNFPESFTATGDRSLENNYLVRQKAMIAEQHELNKFMSLFEREKEDYFDAIAKAEKALNQGLDSLKKTGDIHPLFAQLERAYPTYRIALLNNMYPRYHMHIQGIEDEEDLDFPKEEVEEELMSLDNSNPDFLVLPVFRNVLSSQMYRTFENELPEELYDGTAAEVIGAELDQIANFFDNPKIAEYLTFDYIKTLVVHRGPGSINQFYDRFMEEVEKREYADILEGEMAKWEDLQPGNSVPDFEFEDINGNDVRLSLLNGRLIYIDVWATWCGPCLREHPYWEDLVKEFEGEDVAFLAISIDNTKDPWQEMVNDKSLSGHHWFAENAWNSEFASHFLVNSIPRFILLDRDGNILEPSAERPSGNIATTLRNYLESI
ncbi:MAG: AhpC/TSA family protein [Saprospirales bacterium]|nr:MAG: AhpC/TSA family protein [Saprospirales bacterium]